ncbi:MAG TPA: hypothetical protein VF151_10865 [Gemmatimonadales bacterium]
MAGTTRLALYNGALLLCGVRQIANLSVNEEPRKLLDYAWNGDGTNGAIRACLEQGQWIFAKRAAQLNYDTAIEPSWGYKRAFAKNTDWVATSAVCCDEYFNVPLTAYSDEAGFLYADYDTIYVKYVSDAATYGGDLSRWPMSFAEYVKAWLASKIIYKVSSSQERRDELLHPNTGILERARINALNRDAMAKPVRWPARGTWSKARQGRGSRDWYDGGNRNRLIG